MKRLLALAALAFAFLAGPALASNCSPYPYTLTNGTTADANQVMGNFNAILSCANSTLVAAPVAVSQGGTGATSGSAALGNLGALAAANNLSDVNSASTSRTNLGLGSAALLNSSAVAQTANNLSDLSSASTARTNLGVAYGTTAGTVAQGNDSRFGGPTQNVQCTYGLALTDAGGQIYCNTSGTHTLTIPANASVAFAVGTKIDVVNDTSAGNMTIAITSDTLVWFPSAGTGSRTLQGGGEATLTKVSSTRWIITGTGLT
jgi:hypothetical protein